MFVKLGSVKTLGDSVGFRVELKSGLANSGLAWDRGVGFEECGSPILGLRQSSIVETWIRGLVSPGGADSLPGSTGSLCIPGLAP